MKQLLIILYKINVDNVSMQDVDKMMHEIMESANCLTDDEELKKDYIIKQLFLPTTHEPSDVKVIYPIPRYTTSPEINDLVQEISNRIKEDPDNLLKVHWEKLVRELKLRKINGD